MERTILQRLIEWKKSNNRKPLILNGARQVGKTWILHEFAQQEGNVRANSLTTLLAAQPTMQAVRYSMLPYRRQEQLSCVPLYMIM